MIDQQANETMADGVDEKPPLEVMATIRALTSERDSWRDQHRELESTTLKLLVKVKAEHSGGLSKVVVEEIDRAIAWLKL